MSEYYKDAKEVLAPILEKIGTMKNQKDEEVRSKWSEIAGSKVSTYSSFGRVDKKTLIVLTDDSRYLPFILAQKKRIIDKYNKLFPDDGIRYLKVVVESVF